MNQLSDPIRLDKDFRPTCEALSSFLHENLTNPDMVHMDRNELLSYLLRLSHCSLESITETRLQIGGTVASNPKTQRLVDV